jgi:hypothetical protein
LKTLKCCSFEAHNKAKPDNTINLSSLVKSQKALLLLAVKRTKEIVGRRRISSCARNSCQRIAHWLAEWKFIFAGSRETEMGELFSHACVHSWQWLRIESCFCYAFDLGQIICAVVSCTSKTSSASLSIQACSSASRRSVA